MKSIEICIRSVLQQTYTNLELILVDDGSTDGSGKVCDQYANQDTRVKVIHKENGGVSSARNRGIENAVGDWYSFVDADDFIDKDMYSILMMLRKKQRQKLSSADIDELKTDKKHIRQILDKNMF